MGNVAAASPPRSRRSQSSASQGETSQPTAPVTPTPPSPPLPPPPPIIPEPTHDRKHPGGFEELHKLCKDSFPAVFEGAKVNFQKPLSKHFMVSHCLSMATFQPSTYRFGCTYVGEKQLRDGSGDLFPVALGDIDVDGNLNAHVFHTFGDNVKTRFVTQIKNNKCVHSQLHAEYKGSNYLGSLCVANLDLLNGAGMMVGQYLQRSPVSKRVDIGAELLYQAGNHIPGRQFSVFSLGGRYTSDSGLWVASASVSPLVGDVELCVYHKVQENVCVAAELKLSSRRESSATVGYVVDIPQAHCQVKAQVDTKGVVGAVLETKMVPWPVNFVLSGSADHSKATYRFGIGLQIGN